MGEKSADETANLTVLGNYEVFLAAVVDGLSAKGFDLKGRLIDHICYRVATEQRYAEKKCELATIGRLLHEAQIGGRPIATFALATPISWRGFEIPLVELPAPKVHSDYPEGLEHLEIVVDLPFANLMAQHPAVEFDTSAMNKRINAELRVRVGKFAAKFHHQSLFDVIAAEFAGR